MYFKIVPEVIKNANLTNLNFDPHEIVSRYRDPRLHVVQNYEHIYVGLQFE